VTPLNVLVACEESQAVCLAFRKRGHNAYSCDIQECSGGHPEWHIVGDALEIIKGGWFTTQSGERVYIEKWDLMVAHPPCTYLSNAGAQLLYPKGKLNNDRYKNGLEGKQFFMKLFEASIPKICIENPIQSRVFDLPKHTQQIHPYHFGHPLKKATRLWLRGLKPLMPTEILWKRGIYINTGHQAPGNDSAVRSSKARSKTFPGIANAMASQWSPDLGNTWKL